MPCAHCSDIQFARVTSIVGPLMASESGMVCLYTIIEKYSLLGFISKCYCYSMQPKKRAYSNWLDVK